MELPFRTTAAGIDLFVRLTPKAAEDRISGLKKFGEKSCLVARVRAVPENGRANEALVAPMLKGIT